MKEQLLARQIINEICKYQLVQFSRHELNSTGEYDIRLKFHERTEEIITKRIKAHMLRYP